MWKATCILASPNTIKVTDVKKVLYGVNSVVNYYNNFYSSGIERVKRHIGVGNVIYSNMAGVDGVIKSYQGVSDFVVSFQCEDVWLYDMLFTYTCDQQHDVLTLDQIKF